MPHRLSGVLIFLLVSVMGWAQGESVLLPTNEFRIKVELAKEIGLDTLPSFLMLEKYYRDAFMNNSEKSARKETSYLKGDWVKLSVITIALPQHHSKKMETEVWQRMDSIYQALKSGTCFEMLAEKYSSDSYGGAYVWKKMPYLLAEWREALESLGREEVSRPFYSPIGVHIIRWLERGTGENVCSIADMNVGMKWEQLRDVLLALALEKKYRKPLHYTEKELEAYFEEHRKDYQWDLPYYKGAVIHCRNKKEGKRIRKWLKKTPFEEWKDRFNTMVEGMECPPRMECGLFPIGTNVYVDKLVFKCGEFVPLQELPYTFVYGDKLAKGPEKYKDVYDEVVKDYLDEHQNDWLNELKTVNNGGSY